MKLSIRKLISATLLSVLFSVPAFAGRLIAVDDGTGNFYEIDRVTPSASLLGNANESLSLTGLAYDATNDAMYISDVCGSFCYGIGSVDLTTWEVTEIGSFLNTSNIHALAHDSTQDILFGWDISGELVSIDRLTSEETPIGPGGGPVIVGMTYDPNTDTMFGAARDDDSLYTIDTSTGNTTLVGPLGHELGGQIGMSFDPDTNEMFIGGGGGDFYSINPATGEATLLGNLGFTIDGMATIHSVAPPEPPTPVPATSPFGLLLMVLLLGIFAWRRFGIAA